METNLIKIAVFASGSGSNMENIFNYFKANNRVEIACLLSNKPDAYVLERAKKFDVDFLVFNRQNFDNSDIILGYLRQHNVNFIVLAGFLWLIPEYLINEFPKRIINIHPALLPKYGGKGMYGNNVHRAVKENSEEETGITIHYVNSKYDEGEYIYQKSVRIDKTDDVDDIAQKVHALEYEYFPKIIEKIILDL